MKAPTDGRRPWLWFVALWCAGIMAALLLAYATRWVITLTPL